MTKNFFTSCIFVYIIGYVTGLIIYSAIVTKRSFESSIYDNYSYSIYRDNNLLEKEAIKCDIVHEIDSYIQSIAPTSCVNGLTVFEACQEYNIDIIFVLAQGHLESHFGTTGLAAKTNSVFNVLAYDGLTAEDIRRKKGTYSHPDKSIRPYLELLINNYLVDGKHELDMLSEFVDKDGHRYASNPNYEDNLYNIYKKIQDSTRIPELMLQYNKYQIITNETLINYDRN